MASTIEKAETVSETLELHTRAAGDGFWRDEAPANIAGDSQWQVWHKHLAKRRTPKSIRELCKSKGSPLGWAIDSSMLRPDTCELLRCLDATLSSPKGKFKPVDTATANLLSTWKLQPEVVPASVDFAYECLVVAHLLPFAAGKLSEQRWWQLLDELLQLATSASQWPIDVQMPPLQALVQQMLAGELPVTLAYLFPEMKPCHKLRQAGCDVVGDGLQELTNGQGLLRGPYLDSFRLFLASWTRTRTLLQRLKKCSLVDAAEMQFSWAITQALRLSTDDGRSLLSDGTVAWNSDFLAHVLQTGGDRSDVSAAVDIFSKRLTKQLGVKPSGRFPESSEHCEWAGVSIMRSEWEKGLPLLAVDFSTPELRLEIAAGADSIFKGVWNWHTTVDQQTLTPVGGWEETCWFSDEDVDFIELSIELSGGARIERQIMLARDDQFLLLADYVTNTGGGDIRHRMSIPVCDNVSFATETETREGLLVSNRTLGRVLPLALPEWRVDPRYGELAMIDGSLQLMQQRPGRNLACPLLIDLDRQRARKQCTWRQLTVAQALQIQPHDVAVGYRAQCGKDQWMVYRTLDRAANRSLLGQNISCECLVARFLSPSGEIEELLEIEA